MASITTATQVAPSNITETEQPNTAIGSNRGRGRGGSRSTHNDDNSRGGRGAGHRRGRGGRGSRADGRGNTNQRGRRQSNLAVQPAPPLPPPPGLGGGGSFSGRLTKDAETVEGEGEGKVEGKRHEIQEEDDVEAETEARFVIFTDDANKRYEDFTNADFQQVDENLGIKYEQKDIHADTILLLRYNCPDQGCDYAAWGWPDLHKHVKNAHQRVLCDLCTRNKKVFTHEHELLTMPELRKHEKFGDDNPGAVDQSGFKGHPECGFCRQRFYGDDEIYAHCRDKHEKCHICDRRSQGRQQQYYVDYDSLEQHFRKDHFVCADQECLEKKFVVFESEMDLKAHQLEAHPNGLSKDARRDARRVDISAFEYRTPHQDNRGGRREREGRGRGRGRDPNAEALPQSTAQPMRRDELAYQRQMAIQGTQAAAARTFGGQLTSTDAYAARPSGRRQETVTAPHASRTSDASFPAIDNLNLTSNSSTAPPSSTPTQMMSAHEQARQLQHNAVMDRASAMLKNDNTKIADFRSSVSSYRNSAITAAQLIDAFFSLFDVPSADLGKLIKELADIYENESKRNGLLKAWNDWRAINEDYPTLPGPDGLLPGASNATAGNVGHRVLRLKSSTAQSSRSAVSRQGSWGNSSNGNPFPAMPASSVSRAGAGRAAPMPWVPSTSKLPSGNAQSASRPSTSGKAKGAGDAFPALPAAAKPNTMIAGLTKGTVRWDDPRNTTPAASPWSNANGGSSTSAFSTPPEADAESEVGKKKGKQAKKQTLFKFG